MKMETLIFGIVTLFFLLVTPSYWLLSHEVVGSIALTLAFMFSFIITSYIWATGRRMAPRPEDRLDGEISDSTGEIGFFSPHSVWPLWAGLSFAIAMIGIAVGWWLFAIGLTFALASAFGMSFEYYRAPSEDRPSARSTQ